MVTMGKAALWTDSRYWTQAERQMDCNWELHKEGKRTARVCSPSPGTQTGFGKVQVRGVHGRPCWAPLGSSRNLEPSLIFEADIKEDRCGRTVTDRSPAGRPGVTSVSLPVFLAVGTTPVVTWLLTEIPVGGRVGFDPFLFSISMFFPQSPCLSTPTREIQALRM